MKLNHIVLTTDFSDEAQRPFAPVSSLAKKVGSRVTLVHAIETLTAPMHGGRFETPIVPPEYSVETKEAEEALEEQAALLDPALEVSCQVILGTESARSIVQFAEKNQADLIAMSTHGKTGFRRLILGSVAEEVLRRSPIPVLCIPQRDPQHDSIEEVEHILLTTDLSEDSMRAFGPVLELAKELGCRVTVLNVMPVLNAIPYGAPLAAPVPPPNLAEELANARESLDELCSSLDTTLDLTTEVVSHENPAKGIIEFAAKNRVDLIALSSHGRTGLGHVAFGSVAEQVLRRSSTPVLSFHRPKS